MLSLCQKDLLPRKLETIDLSRLLPFCQRYLRRSWLGTWVILWRVTVCFFLLSIRIVGAWKYMMICSHSLTIYKLRWIRAWREVLFSWASQLHLIVSCGLLHKLRYIAVGRQFMSIVSKFQSDRRQRECLDVKVSASVDVVSGVPQSSVLEPLLFIL